MESINDSKPGFYAQFCIFGGIYRLQSPSGHGRAAARRRIGTARSAYNPAAINKFA